MSRISSIKIISVDLFRTLIDLESTAELIWKNFLKDKYPEAVSKIYWQRAKEISSKSWDVAGIDNVSFKSVRIIFEEICADLFAEIQLNMNVKIAADILVDQHKQHNFFKDAKYFLETVGMHYSICLSTDCDLEMITDIDKLYSFDNIFISEQIHAYKLNPRFFDHVISHYNLEPHNILHIGDSRADVIGPKQHGILTCWLNRHNQQWEHIIKPDFEVNSLMDVIDILKADD